MTVIDPNTGLISAKGTIQTVAANGTAVSLWTAVNPFETGQNWAMVEFTPGIGGSWKKGQIWGWDDGVDSASLKISSPFNDAVAGDPWFKAAFLDLRAESTGDTSAVLYADLLELRGNRMNLVSADGSPFDFRLYATNQIKFMQGVGANQIRFEFGSDFWPHIQARDTDDGTLNHLQLDATNIIFNIEGSTVSLSALADTSGTPWIGRTNGVSGIGYEPTRTLSQNYTGGAIPHAASAHPVVSDLFYKVNGESVIGALDTVRAMDAKRWKWKDTLTDRDNTPGLGFFAQDVEPHIPEAVYGSAKSDGGEGLSVDAMPILATLWAATRELADRLDNLEGVTP
jgi:hypothetical protein